MLEEIINKVICMLRISNLFKKKKLEDLEKKLPNILVVGMPQSGSTALFNIITNIQSKGYYVN